MKKVVLFAFYGEVKCFIHVLLNGMDIKTRGYNVKVVIEGAATKLIPEMSAEGSPLFGLFQHVMAASLMMRAAPVQLNKKEDSMAEPGLAPVLTGHSYE